MNERIKYSVILISVPVCVYNYFTNTQLQYVHYIMFFIILSEYYNGVKLYIKNSNNKDLDKLKFIYLYGIIWLFPFLFTYLNIHSYNINRTVLIKFL